MKSRLAAVCAVTLSSLALPTFAQNLSPPESMRCNGQFQSETARIAKAIADTRRQGKAAFGQLDPAAEAGLAAVEKAVATIKSSLEPKRTKAACDAMPKALADELEKVGAISRTLGEAMAVKGKECQVKSDAAKQETDKMLADAKKSGRITQQQENNFNATENKIRKAYDSITRQFSPVSCQSILDMHASQKDILAKLLASPDPQEVAKLNDCKNKNANTWSEIRAAFAAGRKADAINPGEQQAFRSFRERMEKLEKAMENRSGIGLAECEQLSRQLAEGKSMVAQFAKK